MIRGHTFKMTWGTDTVEIPPLRSSDNGWYYGFDNETLGRGGEGESRSRQVVEDRRLSILRKRNFALPDEVFPKHSHSYQSGGIRAWIEHPGLGQLSVVYNPTTKKLYTDLHPIIYECHNQAKYTRHDGVDVAGETYEIAANIWQVARDNFPILGLISTPEITTTWKRSGEGQQQEDGSYTKVEDYTAFYATMTPDALETLAHSKMRGLIDLFGALGHNDIRLNTSYIRLPVGTSAVGEYLITGVEINVHDEEQEEGHTVVIGSTGEAVIHCGYKESEQKYLEYQKRQLAGWMMNELGGDTAEFDEVTFD